MSISGFRSFVFCARSISKQISKNTSRIITLRSYSCKSNMSNIIKSRLTFNNPKTENLIEFIRDGLRRNASKTIFVGAEANRIWTGQDIEVAVLGISKFLIDQYQIKKGDVCSIYAEENDFVAVLALALMSVGATYHFLSDRSSGWDVHDTAKVIKSKYLFSSHNLLESLKSNHSLAELEEQLQIVSLDIPYNNFNNGCKSLSDFLIPKKQLSDELITFDDLVERTKVNPEVDYAVIQFSSGTTGKPKPIPRTHKNLVHTVAAVDHEELMDLKPGVVISGIIPITHRPGLWAILASVHKGNTFVIWNETAGVENALEMIAKFKVTLFSSSLPFLAQLRSGAVNLKDKHDTSSLKHLITAGAKLVNKELAEAIVETFKLDSLRQCFGMTESGWCFLIERSIAKGNYLSVGHVVPGMEAIILDRATNEKLDAKKLGEIALRGSQIFPGYLTDKQDNLNRSDFTQDGWFKIGDEGYYNEDELVFIEGRYKEKMLFSNDCKFYPTEIEAMINQHGAVEASCIVKIPHDNKDYVYDIARAYVTVKSGKKLSADELMKFLNERMPEAVLDRGIHVLTQFPRLNNDVPIVYGHSLIGSYLDFDGLSIVKNSN